MRVLMKSQINLMTTDWWEGDAAYQFLWIFSFEHCFFISFDICSRKVGVVTRLMKNELLPVNLYRNGGIMTIVFCLPDKDIKKNELIMPLYLSLFYGSQKDCIIQDRHPCGISSTKGNRLLHAIYSVFGPASVHTGVVFAFPIRALGCTGSCLIRTTVK